MIVGEIYHKIVMTVWYWYAKLSSTAHHFSSWPPKVWNLAYKAEWTSKPFNSAFNWSNI